jgi:hypothetical protein
VKKCAMQGGLEKRAGTASQVKAKEEEEEERK